MAYPKVYLPPALTEDSIRKLLSNNHLPDPTSVAPLRTMAEFHTIYLVMFPASVAAELLPAQPNEPDGSVSLVLRVAGKHLPRIKTLNEVAAMTWVRENTQVPIPALVRFDASEKNVIGHEFSLLEKVEGVSVDTVYETLNDTQREFLIIQLIEYLKDLHSHDWHHAGGLSLDDNNKVVPGRLLAESFWQAPEISQFWGPEDTIDSLNVAGPFETYTAYVKGHIKQYIANIQRHPSLEWMRDLIPRFEALNAWLAENAAELDKTRYILSQKDLHFGNIMCDPVTLRITAILDWEFSAVLPLPLWNPGGGFLWNGQHTVEGFAERKRLYEMFEKICQEREPDLLADFNLKTQSPHKAIAMTLNFTRAITEVCPRGEKAEAAREWRKSVEGFLSELGV